MTEQQPETPTPAQGAQEVTESQQTPPAPEPPDETDWKAEARKWETRAKENRSKANEFDRKLKESMSESERAIAEAEERGRTTATQGYGTRLARTEFDALAARRNPTFETRDVLEYVDLSKMVGEDGEPDVKALRSAVERLVPEPKEGAPTFEGGTRTPPQQKQSFGDSLRKEISGRR